MMAKTKNTEDLVEPWTGSGWPLWIFENSQELLEKRSLFCSWDQCGRVNQRIVREPMQLSCGHRICLRCYDHIMSLPAEDRLCHSCQREPFDCDTRVPRTMIPRHLEYFSMPQRRSTMEIDAVPGFDAVPGHIQHPTNADYYITDREFSRIDGVYVAKDNAVKRELNRMRAICPYKCGTPAKITIRTLEKHMISCKERRIYCEKCADIIRFSAKSEHAANSCPYRIVNCPNECGKKGLKEMDLTQHIAECENRRPTCNICRKPYALDDDLHSHLMNCVTKCPLNCGVTGDVNLTEHLDDPEMLSVHIAAVISLLLEAKSILNSSQPEAEYSGITQSDLPSILERLVNLETKSDMTERSLAEQISHLTPDSAKALLENVRLAEVNHNDLSDLDALFKGAIEDTDMLSAYGTALRSLTEKITKQKVGTTESMNKLEAVSNIRIAEIKDQKTTLDHIQKTSYNGRLIWKIDNVQRHRDDSQTRHSIYSHPFYTEVYGYKMCARIYFNGDGNGKNTHISLFFVVMKGEYDALLPWPFQQKVTMKLINQKKFRPDIVEKFRPEPSSSSFQRPKNEMNIASGCPQFAEQSLVFAPESGFVVDDTVFVEISVDNSYDALHQLNVSTQQLTQGYSNPRNK